MKVFNTIKIGDWQSFLYLLQPAVNTVLCCLCYKQTLLQVIADHNSVAELAPNMFNGLVNLTMVNLTYNRLETFPLSALTLSLGKSIFIGNKSVKLPFLIYADHGTLMLALSNNPLECDCEMEWLQRINSLAAKSPRYVHNDMICHDSMVANR